MTARPSRWDDDRRFLLRCELDAFYFHLYGIVREDASCLMGTFPITRRKEEQRHGEYRTKRVILEIYDAMAEAQHTGATYQTRLDPPPARSAGGASRDGATSGVAFSSASLSGPLRRILAAAWATPDLVAPEHLAFFALIDVIRAFNGAAKAQRCACGSHSGLIRQWRWRSWINHRPSSGF